MGPLGRLWRIVAQLRRRGDGDPLSNSSLDGLILEQWSSPALYILHDPEKLLATTRILKHTLAAGDGRIDQVHAQVILQILRRAGNAILSWRISSTASSSSIDMRGQLVEIVYYSLSLLVRCASNQSTSATSTSKDDDDIAVLQKDIMCQAADLASSLTASRVDLSPIGGHLIAEALAMWSQSCRLQACPGGLAIDRIAMILSSRSTIDALLTSGPSCWTKVLKVLLIDLNPSNAISAQKYHRLVQVAIRAVAQSIDLWAWEALIDVLHQLPGKALHGNQVVALKEEEAVAEEEEESDDEEEDEELMTPEHQRRRQAVYAVLEIMDIGNPTEKAVAGLSAIALLSGRFHSRLWEEFVSLARKFTGEKAEEWRTGRAGMARALIVLGLSPVCSRSLKAEESKTGGVDWGICLLALLCLALEELIQDCSPLAVSISQRVLQDSEEAATAVGELFKLSDSTSQIEALSIMRSYARDLATKDPEAYQQGGSKSFMVGAVLIVRICCTLCDPSHAAISSTDQAIWILDILHASSATALDSVHQLSLLRASYNLKSLLETEDEGFENSLNAARDWVLKKLRKKKKMMASQAFSSASVTEIHKRARSLSYLIRLSFDLCIDTLRPGPYLYVSQLTKLLLDEITEKGPVLVQGAGSDALLAKAQAHRCLRALVSRPNLLAYRAGTQHHWDEARRRVTAIYVKAALESYPSRSTTYQDLAYCLGTAIGAASTDTIGGALVLYCIHVLQERALSLCRNDKQLKESSTSDVVKLLFQTLVVCPPRVLGTALTGVAEEFFLMGLKGNRAGRLTALAIFQEIASGEVETMRQTRLAKWYLKVLHECNLQDVTSSSAASPSSSIVHDDDGRTNVSASL